MRPIRLLAFATCFALLSVAACKKKVVTGITLTSSSVANFPSELDHRMVLRGALTNPSDANDYVGYVLTIYGNPNASNGSCQPDTSRPPNPGARQYLRAGVPVPPTVPMTHVWFQSIVTDSAQVAVEYLGSKVAIGGNQVTELVIEDVAKAEVQVSDIDYAALGQLARTPLAPGECQRLIILRTYLTSVKNRIFNQVGADMAGGYVGVKVNGAYYSTSEQLETNLILAMDARDIHDLATNPTAGSLRSLDIRRRDFLRGIRLPRIPGHP